ncbi:MAG: glycerophosphodiester phosphodiesterase [Spirochaetes bacterium]|jgi:glycerophosphoryl diester phosphodiesterase|nr:glycerophosphodiester phosphodiesterase [Spirochaetota bacterium]
MTRSLPQSTGSQVILGHRGYSALAPENTLVAFDLIRHHGVPGIETDLQLCASGEIVCFHDWDLTRIAGHKARVENVTYEELRRIDAGRWFSPDFANTRIPTLPEVVELLGSYAVYDLELKTSHIGMKARRLAARVIEELREHAIADRCIISSFNPFVLAWARRLSEDIPTALIYTVDPRAPLPARTAAAQGLLSNELLKPDYAYFQRELDPGPAQFPRVPRLVWTVDGQERIDSALGAGAFGVISNDPAGVLG